MKELKVLVVDDEKDIRELIIEFVFHRRHIVIEAIDGMHAQNIIKEANPPFDIVVTDNNMPNMNGHDLVTWIKKHRPETFVILMSGKKIYHPRANRNILKINLLKEIPKIIKDVHDIEERIKSGIGT